MTRPQCDAPVSNDDLLDYWIHAIDGKDAEQTEEHLFRCPACSARFEAMAGSHGRGRGSERQNEEEERAADHVPDAIGCALRRARASHSARVLAAVSGVVP